jgi:hypothetical protein
LINIALLKMGFYFSMVWCFSLTKILHESAHRWTSVRTHIRSRFWSYRAPYFFKGVLFDSDVWSLFPDKLVVLLFLLFVVIAVFVIMLSLFILRQLCKICVRWQSWCSRKALYIDNWLYSILTFIIKVKLLAWSR